MKPTIGISVQYNEEKTRIDMNIAYMKAIYAAGGFPIIIPMYEDERVTAEYIDRCDAVLLSGGEDVNPALYGEQTEPGCGRITDLRDTSELNILKIAMARRMPIMGICRGIQVINVGLGGKLYQHIPNHRAVKHSTAVERDSVLHPIMGDRCITNSSHHQAISRPGKGLRVIARAADGIIEGVFHRDYPFLLGVQWHPEAFFVNEGDAVSLEILKLFVSKAEAYRSEHNS